MIVVDSILLADFSSQNNILMKINITKKAYETLKNPEAVQYCVFLKQKVFKITAVLSSSLLKEGIAIMPFSSDIADVVIFFCSDMFLISRLNK